MKQIIYLCDRCGSDTTEGYMTIKMNAHDHHLCYNKEDGTLGCYTLFKEWLTGKPST